MSGERVAGLFFSGQRVFRFVISSIFFCFNNLRTVTKETQILCWKYVERQRTNKYPWNTTCIWYFFFYNGATAPVGQELLFIEDSRLPSDTPHSVVLLWTSDRPDAETSIWPHSTLKRDEHLGPPLRDSNPQSRQVSGHWNRHVFDVENWNCYMFRLLIKPSSCTQNDVLIRSRHTRLFDGYLLMLTVLD